MKPKRMHSITSLCLSAAMVLCGLTPAQTVYAVEAVMTPTGPQFEVPVDLSAENTPVEDFVLTSDGDIVITPETEIDGSKNLVVNADGDVLITSGTVLNIDGDVTINAGGEIIIAPDAEIHAGGEVRLNAEHVEGNGPLSAATLGSSLQINSDVTVHTVSAFPHEPAVMLENYNSGGRSQYPGYSSFVPKDRHNFSYRYDVGAAGGATVDVVIAKNLVSADLSGDPFKMRFKRENKVQGFDGLDQISVIFVDAAGEELEFRVDLSDGYQEYEFDLDQTGFLDTAVKQVILRQTFEDIDQNNYQEERRGEIFVNVGNLDVPVASNETGFNGDFLTEFNEGTSVESSGFIRGAHTVPGFITLVDDNAEDDEIGFRYDVGGSDGAVVNTEIRPPSGETFDLGQSFVMGMKNSGNGAKVAIRVVDENNEEKEFIVSLTDQYQNIYLNFDDPQNNPNEIDFTKVKKIIIEVTRTLSPERRGRIDFYVPIADADPFTQLRPEITSATSDAVGNTTVDFSSLTDALVYQVQISRNAAFTDIVHEGFPSSSPELVKIEESGTFYVRVLGSKSNQVEVGPLSQWSETAELVIERIVDAEPMVTGVSTGNESGITRIDFDAIPGAAIYHVEVATDPDFTNVVHNGFPSGNFETVNLETNGDYYVRYKGSVDGNFVVGFTSPVSSNFMFTRNAPSRVFNPDESLDDEDITDLPDGEAGEPGITSLGSGGDSSDAAVASDRGVKITYNTGTQGGGSGGFAGGGFTYDDFGTNPAIETGDLSGISDLVFGLKADASRVKLEIVDADGNSSFVHLEGISSSEEQFWSIPASRFESVDLTRVRILYFIVEGHDQSGELCINRLPADVIAKDYDPDNTLTDDDITALPDGEAGEPGITSLGSGGDSSDAASAADRGVEITYNTGTAAGNAGGFAGGGFTYDNFGTGPFESGNLSGLGHLIFGVQGDSPDLKLEIVDKDGNSASVHLHNISSTVEQFYKIPTAAFEGINLAEVRIIYFIVEGHNQSGSFTVNRLPDDVVARNYNPDNSLTALDITQIPPGTAEGGGFVTSLGSGGDSSDDVELTARGLRGIYNTGTQGGGSGGFAGAGAAFDDFATTPIETGDLSGFSEIIFGVKGDSPDLKLEVIDKDGHSNFVHLHNISPTVEQFYRIPAAAFDGVNLAEVRIIYFIVEGHNQSGTFEVYDIPLVEPSNLGTDEIVDFSGGQVQNNQLNLLAIFANEGGSSATFALTGDNRGTEFQFNTGTPGFAGAGYGYDQGGGEAGDLSGLTELTFGLKGIEREVGLVIEDHSGSVDVVVIDGILTDQEQVFVIPLDLFPNVDLTDVKNIFFLYEGQNVQGTLFIYNKPVPV